MKIDAYRTDIPTEALDRVGKPATAVGNRDTKGAAVTPAAGDEVRLSSDARLMQTVMQNAQEALSTRQDVVNIRQDVVDRMRAALANGQVGNDPHALADALLDRLISTSSRTQS